MSAEFTLNQIGLFDGKPIAILHTFAKGKDWIALCHAQGVKTYLGICFWSTRDEDAIMVEELASAVKHAVGKAGSDISEISEVAYFQPHGWDRWLSGIPEPIGSLYDDKLGAAIRKFIFGDEIDL